MLKKISFFNILFFLLLTISSCKKDKQTIPESKKDNYTSLENFYSTNGIRLQTYSVNAASGGSFTSSQGTVVTIPANCFKTASNTTATGTVSIEFKDLYKKSDMLLSKMHTTFFNGSPLKSGGEFFIKASMGDSVLQIIPGKAIEIEQPLQGLAVDTAMKPMILGNDTAGIGGNGNGGWFIDPNSSLSWTTSSYIFSLYNFTYPLSSGSWCNSDNSSYFAAFPQTALTLHPLENDPHTDVFLIFNNVNSMVHVYESGGNYPYLYAPLGQQCTLVVISVKDGKLYSCFKPITITNNLTVDFSTTETTTEAFKAQLNALN